MSRLAAIFLSLCLASASFATDAVDSKEIATNGTAFTAEAFLQQVGRDLTAHYNFEGELDLDFVRQWAAPSGTARVWTIKVEEYPSTPTASMYLRCQVLGDGKVVANDTVFLRMALWRDVWATRAPLTIGATFNASQLEARRVDMMRERDALPASVGDRNYIFSRGVQAGRVLTWRDISRRPLVRKGDTVEVSAVDGALTITMKAVAMENGAQGDTVTIRNPDSRRDFSAQVVDENRVQVRF
jgi:flagella basal body P-ring formation protein FlgA